MNQDTRVTQKDYDEYLSYTRAMLFSHRRHLAGDILQRSLELSAKHNYSKYYVYFTIRMEVMKQNKYTKESGIDIAHRPTEQPKPYLDMGVEHLLEALRNVVVYTSSDRTNINYKQTNRAHKTVLLTAKGYSNEEIAKEIGLPLKKTKDLKYRTVKQLKKILDR